MMACFNARMKSEESRWQEFFNDPSEWWDNRAKKWKDYPDFKHVSTGKGLWISSPQCPKWVVLKLNSLKEASHSENARAEYTDIESPPRRSASPKPSIATLLATLKECCRSRDLQRGREAHSVASETGFSSNIHVASSLINMYAKCGALQEARKLFDAIPHPNVVTWNCLIWGYVDNGESQLALELYDAMQPSPDGRTYVAALSACAALAARWRSEKFESSKRWLEKGRDIHARATASRSCDIFVESSLVDMYSRCGSMPLARAVFDRMTQRNVVSWNALLQGYVENGEGQVALELFDCMERGKDGCAPNSRTFVAVLSACATLRWLQTGRELHARAVTVRCCDNYVENTLVDMYAKCRSMADARDVFENMQQRSVVSWTALVQGYVENNESEVALRVFEEMRSSGCTPHARTFLAALSACASLASGDRKKWLAKGKFIHSLAAEHRCCDGFVDNTLVDMYAKCGSMADARTVFNGMSQRNVVSWTALIMGYAENGEEELALELVAAMDASGTARTALTYVAALTACGNLMALESGAVFHADIRSCGLDKDVIVCNCLVDFYGKCGSMESAKKVFDSVGEKTLVSWNSLMCGYSFGGDSENVFTVFRSMREHGFAPNEVTFVCLLSACSHAGLREQGKELFSLMKVKYGITPNVKHYACLIDLLGRGNYLEEALRVLTTMLVEPDVVTWTAMLGACRKWNNVGIGRLAFESFLKLNGRDSSAFVLMASIYRAANRDHKNHDESSEEISTTTWIDQGGAVHRFVS